MTTDIIIKGKVLQEHYYNSQTSSFYIYQFQLQDNKGLYQVINIHSKKNLNLKKDDLVELPILITLYNNEINYEFKKAK